MRVDAVKRFDMQRDSGIDREGLEPFAHQFGIEIADFLARELGLEDKERAARHVNGDAGQRFIHRQEAIGITANAFFIAKCLFEGLAQCNADILNRVMLVDFEIALAGDRHIKERMAGEKRQHMIEKTDPARKRRLSRAVEREAHGNFRFRCLAGDAG